MLLKKLSDKIPPLPRPKTTKLVYMKEWAINLLVDPLIFRFKIRFTIDRQKSHFDDLLDIFRHV